MLYPRVRQFVVKAGFSTTDLLSVITDTLPPVLEFQINKITLYLFLCAWLFLLSIIFQRFILFSVCINILIISTTEWSSNGWVYEKMLSQLPVNGPGLLRFCLLWLTLLWISCTSIYCEYTLSFIFEQYLGVE